MAAGAVLVFGLFLYLRSEDRALISPVAGVGKTSFAENIWFPDENATTSGEMVEISAKAAFFIDTYSGTVLFEKNSRQKLPIASLVKIMTVVVALENRQLDELLEVSEKAAGIEPDKMLLKAYEKLTVEELLSGIFLVSANDGAEVLAEGAVGNRDDFIDLMNEKALQLGLKDTRFINPTGLEEDGREQYSTAFDIAVLSRYTMRRWPRLLEISARNHIYLPETDTHQDYDMYSGINLLTTYPGVVGFKTGFTPQSGLTLVTIARRQGYEVLGVLLGSSNRREDARTLLDYSFARLGVGKCESCGAL